MSSRSRECEKCGKEFNYYNRERNSEYYEICLKNERTRGSRGTLFYCVGCAPFGNTSIPEKI